MQKCIVLIINDQTKYFPYPSGAARSIVKISVNGWKFWKVKIGNEMKETFLFEKII